MPRGSRSAAVAPAPAATPAAPAPAAAPVAPASLAERVIEPSSVFKGGGAPRSGAAPAAKAPKLQYVQRQGAQRQTTASIRSENNTPDRSGDDILDGLVDFGVTSAGEDGDGDDGEIIESTDLDADGENDERGESNIVQMKQVEKEEEGDQGEGGADDADVDLDEGEVFAEILDRILAKNGVQPPAAAAEQAAAPESPAPKPVPVSVPSVLLAKGETPAGLQLSEDHAYAAGLHDASPINEVFSNFHSRIEAIEKRAEEKMWETLAVYEGMNALYARDNNYRSPERSDAASKALAIARVRNPNADPNEWAEQADEWLKAAGVKTARFFDSGASKKPRVIDRTRDSVAVRAPRPTGGKTSSNSRAGSPANYENPMQYL